MLYFFYIIYQTLPLFLLIFSNLMCELKSDLVRVYIIKYLFEYIIYYPNSI